MNNTSPGQYVSRAGEKLAAALRAFAVDPTGLTCADLGCNVGGFTDCLLQLGAAKVYAVDTGYGALAWKLRKDPRVVVMERTNALHVELPEAVALVVIDVGWTRQRHVLPAAARLLGKSGRIVTLIKPHYEADAADLRGGVLPNSEIERVMDDVRTGITQAGFSIEGLMESPRRGQKGNREFLALVRLQPLNTP
jgi:23S rRNA (cytidine1920-2'-O)/16S rRNA (cytidine1409-2'-O)-methyltransferase